MPKTAKPSTLPMTGKVKAKSAYGIQLEEMPEVWLNWSLPEYRKEPWHADDVEKGDYVDLMVSGKYIKSIEIIEPPADEGMVGTAKMRDDIHALADEMDEDAFEGYETAPEGRENRMRSPIAVNREQSIQNQVALKCAVELAIGMRGTVTEGQTAGPLNGAFVVSIYKQFRDALNEQ